ncbi:undecaprenyldiphospho-muramoylpentapeptide beta-N-acetylglucosaminyltransferase [Orientia chuto str. Dubai]|uniref:UDP-N-acetylglucosamine--N-acetylmuramyl-(pentapeptide) pyrophosphoryl-undecaprenol N-acetylglucosamine transferase n=1 Tax=Orientia chuto str. Dubai TaxID=1359168 RepID=A0A0F3MNN4_9RICK|nr:undecaprenyldiphospho-muramoylpentapeptide beta-N-acetylglucosaminyltransferase [Candidatus Orientia mediorientalis]KJV57271.1 undecaprenyldiphospho-muramoylpentapeptide beta-N-acetylglucosaminyltransferase [Orientia chuto str. Dubai]
MKTIFLVGGGTGGHLFPAIALGEELQERGYNVHLITDTRCAKYLLNSNYNFKIHIMNIMSISNIGIKKFFFYIKILAACISGLKLVWLNSPSLIVAFGGYTIIPIIINGILFNIPFILHEQNSVLGRANSFFLRYAKALAITFANTLNLNNRYKDKVIFTGTPVRKALRLVLKRNFNSQTFQLLVIGGSQGAEIFSTLIPNAIRLLVNYNHDYKITIVHQAPAKDISSVKAIYTELNIVHEVSDFFYNIADKYKNSHLAISRAGASSISEIISLYQPAILVPYPFASQNHQLFNAKALANNNAGWCIEQSSITPQILFEKILTFMQSPTLLASTELKLQEMKIESEKLLANAVEKFISI